MKRHSIHILMAMLLSACGNDENHQINNGINNRETTVNTSNDPILLDIQDLEKKIASDTIFNRTHALRLFKNYQDYYNKHPKDTVGGNYLFEAANLAQKLGKYERAIELFINFQEGFRNSDRCDEAVYNIAYIYDARLGDKTKAAKYYNKVIELYPQSMWAQQAQGALRILNMTEEDLRKFLHEKNS